jgi:tetratricopeptide (TPR) repeat protein
MLGSLVRPRARSALIVVLAAGLMLAGAWSGQVSAQSAKEQADAALMAGLDLYRRQDYRGAERCWQAALHLYRGEHLEEEEAYALHSLGDVAAARAQYDKASAYYHQALAIFRKLQLPKEEADTLCNLGIVECDLAQHEKALAYYGQALAIFRELELPRAEATVLHNLGAAAHRLAQYDKASAYYDQALAIFRELELPRQEAGTLNNLGVVAHDLAQHEGAQAYYEQALAIYRKLGLPREEADVLNNLGRVAHDLAQYDKALAYYGQAVAVYRKLELPKDEADVLNNLGVVAADLAQYDKALAYCGQALAIYRKLELPREEADTLNNLGVVAEDLAHYDKALAYYGQALAIYRKLGLPWEAWTAQLNIAEVFLDKEDLAAARSALARGSSPLRWGRYHLLAGQYREAAASFEGAAKEAGETFSYAVAAWTGLGLAREGLGEWEKAERAYGKAVELIEQARENTPPSARRRFFEARDYGLRRLEAYEGLVRTQNRLNRPEKALEWSEHTKSRTLLEALARTPYGANLGIPPELRKQEQDLSNRAASLEKRIDDATEKGRTELRKYLERELSGLREEQQTLVALFWRDYPEYAAMQYPKPVEVGALALGEGEVLIEYEVTDRETLVFVVRGGKVVKSFRAGVSREELNRMVESYRSPFVEVGHARSFEPFSKLDVRLGHRLYELLLEPALAEVSGTEKVLMVPDEMLCLLPFEALVEELPAGEIEWEERGHGLYPKGVRYVGDRRVLSFWQSGSALTVVRRLHKGTGGGELLAVADPVFSASDPRVGGSSERVAEAEGSEGLNLMHQVTGDACKHVGWEQFPRLSTTSGFVEGLRKLHGRRVKALMGLEACESRVKGAPLGDYGLGVVFATHGIVDERVPYLQQATLVLSNPELAGEPSDGSVDGFLTMSEVMGLKMPTEVAAALACVTGMGGLVGGEGVMNLGRAFQYAGARSVLVSLWSVSDESTNVFGERFFAGLKRGESKDAAVLAARRQLREQGYGHPFHWAALVLIGERDVVTVVPPQSHPPYWLFAVVGGLLAAVAFWLLLRRLRWRRAG